MLLKNFNIDLICLQEFKINDNLNFEYIKNKLKEVDYNIFFTENINNFGNAIISKFSIEINDEIILPNDKFPYKKSNIF